MSAASHKLVAAVESGLTKGAVASKASAGEADVFVAQRRGGFSSGRPPELVAPNSPPRAGPDRGLF
jgi:hypothetical protein